MTVPCRDDEAKKYADVHSLIHKIRFPQVQFYSKTVLFKENNRSSLRLKENADIELLASVCIAVSHNSTEITPKLAIARMISRILPFFAAMLLTLLYTLSLQHNSHVCGELMMATTTGLRTGGTSKASRAYPSSGAAVRGLASHETIKHNVLALERHERKLGIEFHRCGDSVIFCLVTEVCVESGSPSSFTCKLKEETLATANSSEISPTNSTEISPTPSPPGDEAPVAVSNYWDDPKATSPRGAKAGANPRSGNGLAKAGASGMSNTYDLDGDGAFDASPIYYSCAALFVLGIICVCIHESNKGKE